MLIHCIGVSSLRVEVVARRGAIQRDSPKKVGIRLWARCDRSGNKGAALTNLEAEDVLI